MRRVTAKRPALRSKAAQKRVVVKRNTGRNGVAARVAHDVAQRLGSVRALWFAVQNDPKHSVADLAAEFYYAVGEVLEGRDIRSLSLRKIDAFRVAQHAED